LSFVAILATGFGVGAAYWHHKDVHANDKRNKQYNLLASHTLLDKPSDFILDFTDLRHQVKDYADKNVGKDNASIYFQYLPTGTAFGYGETRSFTGASLIKLAFVMDIYKLAEQGKVNLDTKVALKQEWLDDGYGTLYKQGTGYSLSYRDAIKFALEDSDNTVINMIHDALKASGMTPDQEAINYLDIDFQLTAAEQVNIGAKSYTSFLGCLYFSCYLQLNDSQEILNFLTMSSSVDRLTAQIPKGAVVAHKIGTFSNEVESDCGIFYIPNRNYSLCIMLKQSDPVASQHISDISKMVYDYVSTVSPPPK